MRLVSIEHVQEGAVLAKSILNHRGRPLLHAGVILTPSLIRRLVNSNVSMIYIEDSRTDGIQVQDVLSEETRRKALTVFQQDFHKIAEASKLGKLIDGYPITQNFRGTVQDILRDIRANTSAMTVLMDINGYDQYTFKHSLNVTYYTLAIALHHNFSEQQLVEIGLGAILHDVGKINVPEKLLHKSARLTLEEFEVIKRHTTEGFDMLRAMEGVPLLAAHCAFQHHERLNGSGYPRGLHEKDIHPYARILGIADVFDAMTTHRPYRKGMLPHVALETICQGAGTLFDAEYVETFKQKISMYPIGMEVKLSNGYSGIIVDQNAKRPVQPIVRLLKDERGEDIIEIIEIDLSKDLSVQVEECILL